MEAHLTTTLKISLEAQQRASKTFELLLKDVQYY